MINYDQLMALEVPEVVQRYSARDAILYALGLGFGDDPTDPDQLRFLDERALSVMPTLPLVLGLKGSWIRDNPTGLDYRKIVHGEQIVRLHAPVPPAGEARATLRIREVIDKGEGRGALVYAERAVHVDEVLVATLTQVIFARGDGGFGGPPREQPAPHVVPDRAPDYSVSLATLPQQALIYRLSGDCNPLHLDPELARSAGFERPILHGLATFGIATRAVLSGMAGNDPARISEISGRFTKPVYPGETLETQLWRDGGIVSFRTLVADRDMVVLDNGRARLN